MICLMYTYCMEMYVRANFILKMKMELQKSRVLEEKKLSKALLGNVIPKFMVNQLLSEFTPEKTIFYNNQFMNASVLFSDLVSFTVISSSLRPKQVVDMLNEQFSTYDAIAKRHGLEKIKTVGDAYFAISYKHKDNAVRIISAALEMKQALDKINTENKTAIQIRIGCSTERATLFVFGSIAYK